MPITTSTIDVQYGSTTESYLITVTYNEDLNGDGFNDIGFKVEQTGGTYSGTEDIKGLFLDLNDQWFIDNGLDITQLSVQDTSGVPLAGNIATINDTGDFSLLDGNIDGSISSLLGAGDYDLGLSLWNDSDPSTTSTEFVISYSGQDIDADQFMDEDPDGGHNVLIRTQSTDGGDGSAKTGGTLIIDPPPPPPPPGGCGGHGQTPGFWKTHEDIFESETGISADTSYAELFGIDPIALKIGGGKNAVIIEDPDVMDALDANGGGEFALMRSSTAAYANAQSDDVYYSFADDDTIGDAIIDVYNLDVDDPNFAATYQDKFDQTMMVLEDIDTDDDEMLSSGEIITAVQNVYDDTISEPYDVKLLAAVLDTMNNMPSIDVNEFDDGILGGEDCEEDDWCDMLLV